MNKINKKLDFYFENQDLTQSSKYSYSVVKSIVRSILEPIANNNSNAVIFLRLKDIKETQSLIQRLEYSSEVTLKEFSDFEFSKFDVEETGIVVLSSTRYNCAFLFRKTEDEKYQTYLKINSCLVNDVYETLKYIFLIDYDEKFYKSRPERRENLLMNNVIENILKHYEETIEESEYNVKIQENYKTINKTNNSISNEMYSHIKQLAHEIKNQLSILDIYTRIFEKKTNDTEVTEPIKKSVELMKKQIEKFKTLDVINLQEKNIKLIIQNSIKTYSDVLKEKNNRLVLIDEIPSIEANAFVDDEKFEIVVGNIIKNANDSTQDDEITIRLRQEEEKIKIYFINHGKVIEQENQSKIFNQGFTTKENGWGIGLAVCKKIIGSQFGTFELIKSDESETVFAVTIPLIQTK